MGQKIDARTIYVMSDASGEGGSFLLHRALEQFSDEHAIERRFPNVRTSAEIARVMHAARNAGALVIFTFGDEYLRATACTAAEGQGVSYVSLFDPLIDRLKQWLGKEPFNRPGHKYDEKYFARMDAFDFATSHDDGKRLDELGKADIVVLGLSRSSKSPVCRQLAEHRLLAANIPIVPGVGLPAEVEKIDPRRVYVLRIGLERLLAVRESRRLSRLGTDSSDPYVDRELVREEIQRINRLAASRPRWTFIDVTRRAVEETAAMILSMHQTNFP